MSDAKFTSASRLLAEANRALSVFTTETPINGKLEEWLGAPDVHWSTGLIAYRRLIDLTEADLVVLSESRQGKYAESISKAAQLIEPRYFGQVGSKFVPARLDSVTLDRLDSLDEHLIQAGRQFTVDQDQAAYIDTEISSLQMEVDSWDSGELRDILLSRLAELRFVIGRYELFGPEGAKHAVGNLVGSLSVFGATHELGKDSEHTVKRAFVVAKGVMDVLVYVQAGVQALVWSGAGAAALLSST